MLHLDTAGSALPWPAAVAAQVAHLGREAEVGGYRAEDEAADTVALARDRLAALVGLPPGSVALAESATRAFADLVVAWPRPPGAAVGVVASEYPAFSDALRRTGARLVPLATTADGRLLLDGLEAALGTGLDLVSLPHVASHRGVVQPVADAAARCRAAGVPLFVDVAQTAGHLPLADIGAAAYVGTGRKWLRGPRGVGFVAVDPAWAPTLPRGVGGLEAHETSVAARVGLAAALAELDALGIHAVAAAITAAGPVARARLDGCAGWRVVEPLDEPSGIVTLAHPVLEPVEVRRHLAAVGVHVAAFPVHRAPADLPGPVLRASFRADQGEASADCLAAALARLGAGIRR